MSAVFPPLEGSDFVPPLPFAPDREVAQLRVPPHSIEAESSVLGGLLLDNNAWDRLSEVHLGESDFYRHEHQLIYTAIGALVNFAVAFAVDKMTPEPPEHIQHMVEAVRTPRGSKLVGGAH